MRLRRLLLISVMCLLCGCGLCGCGLQPQETPQPIHPDQLPREFDGRLDQPTPEPTPVNLTPAPTVEPARFLGVGGVARDVPLRAATRTQRR